MYLMEAKATSRKAELAEPGYVKLAHGLVALPQQPGLF
jgi:hypothetical protein